MSIEVEIPQTIISNKAIEVEYSNSNTAIAEGTKELEVSVNRREYNIVGDELYIPKRYEDAPQWLRDVIDTVTSAALSGALSDVSTLGDMLDGLIAELEVAKNTYTMSIISDNDINERINTAIETLNSSLADADSTILNIAMTRVTPEEAQTIAIGILSASISGGDIAAAVQNLQSAIADVDSARALDYTRLTAQIGDGLDDEATARSEAISYLTTDVSSINGTLTTQAGQITALQTSASTVDIRIATAKSDVTNTLNTTITNGDIAVQSKWAYNSIVNINGVYKKSGFGLTTNYTSGNGTEADPYVSEFWIDASRLKFTNSAMTGRTAPFTIDASGPTPQVTFNGKVTFSNISDSATYIPTISSVTAAQTTANTAIANVIKGTNLIYEDWDIGSGSTTVYSQNGISAENYRVYGNNHLGQRVVLWECRPDAISDADGGWNTTSFAIDKTKAYRFSVFVKTSANTGTTFLGCGWDTVCTLNTTTADTNPYFWAGDLPSQNEWYLIVGYVYPTGTTGMVSSGGIYNCSTGNKVVSITDFNWTSTATSSQHRCYHFYDTTTTTRQYMWNPRVDKIDGNEPSIIDLIGNFTKVEDISWQSEVQAAINNNATYIDGGKIVTNTLYGDRLIGNTVSADKLTSSTGTSTTWTGGGLVSQNFNGNVSGSIGSPTQGFRLSSNAAGTSTDPNIYGAYIKGATMDSTSIKVVSATDSSKSGNIFYSKTLVSPVAYGSSYGSGYLPDRICNSNSIIEILASFSITTGENTYNTNVLEYSIDNQSTWAILDSKTYLVSGGVVVTTLPIFLFGTLYGSSIGANTYVVFRVRTTSGNTAVNTRIKLAIYNS